MLVRSGRSVVTGALAAALAGIALQCVAAEATLKVVTVFPRNHTFNIPVFEMLNEVNAKGKGVLQLQYIGGPEAVPPTEQLSALQRGVFDIFAGPASYYDGQVPETGAHNASNKSAMELRKDGALDLLNKAFNAKANAQYLAYLGSGYTFYIFTRSEPRRNAAGGVDLQGLKIRGPSIYRPFYETLGVTAVNVQVPEMYSALERGVIEGIGFPLIGLTGFGWEKQVHYRVLPAFWQGDVSIIANLDAWKKLDAKQRQFLQNAVIETERKAHSFFQAESKREEEKLVAAGMKDVQQSPAEARKYAAAAHNSLWEQLGKRLSKQEVDTLRRYFYKE
jgi:TRAP-type C4-dicarboxylate transport system substrate-binding protein